MPAFAIYFILFFACIVYAVVLQAIHNWYTPDYVWATVVIGNVFIGIALLALCRNGVLPLAAFWHLVGLNICAGTPIIVWQIWQMGQRNGARQRH